MTDKIAEIRARHAQSEKNYIELESTWKAQVHEDRATLLAEVERLHKAHQAACEGGDALRAELMQAIGLLEARLDTAIRERDEARAEVERLKSEPETLRAELIAICNASRAALANAYDQAREYRETLEVKP